MKLKNRLESKKTRQSHCFKRKPQALEKWQHRQTTERDKLWQEYNLQKWHSFEKDYAKSFIDHLMADFNDDSSMIKERWIDDSK